MDACRYTRRLDVLHFLILETVFDEPPFSSSCSSPAFTGFNFGSELSPGDSCASCISIIDAIIELI